MTAALIFWRQLVRHSFKLATSSTADKLPLKKFHRLLDLVFRVNFKNRILYHLLYFFSSLTGYYRVLPGITQSGFKQAVSGACGAPILAVAAGGAGHN